ncbi:MAG: flagellar biosynthetic protein FliR [Planctomycetota bacterium]
MEVLELWSAFLPGFFLTFVRMATMVMTMFAVGATFESRWARLLLALGLTLIVYLRAPTTTGADLDLLPFALVVVREVVLGLAMGFALQLVFTTMRIAGSILGQEMGFAMSTILDPATGVSSGVMARLFEALCFLFLFAVDGHHRMIEILALTYDHVPVGAPYSIDALAEGLVLLSGKSLNLAFSLAFPIWGVLMIVNGTLLVMSRIVPQVNLMEFSFGLRILVAVVLLAAFTTSSADFVLGVFDTVFEGTYTMLGGLR